MTLGPGVICVIRVGARDVFSECWGNEVTLVEGPRDMHWWPTEDLSGPSHYRGPAWIVSDGTKTGYVLEESLEPKRPPREPTVSWDDVPYFNPTKESVTCL